MGPATFAGLVAMSPTLLLCPEVIVDFLCETLNYMQVIPN
jgi:hypothetical protein